MKTKSIKEKEKKRQIRVALDERLVRKMEKFIAREMIKTGQRLSLKKMVEDIAVAELTIKFQTGD